MLIHHSKHWLSAYSIKGVPQLLECLKCVESIQKPIRLVDYHLEGGRFSLLGISRALRDFREHSDSEIEVVRLDYPMNNFTNMLKIMHDDPESYSHLPRMYTLFSSGDYRRQIFACESVSIQYVSHLLSGVDVAQAASDHFFPSLSKDPTTISQRKTEAKEALVDFLMMKHRELIPGGMLYFDVLGEVSQNNVFDLVNESVMEALNKGILPQEFKRFGYRTHFRTKEEIDETLQEVSELFEVTSYKEFEVKMPHFEEFEQNRDAENYAEGLVLFWLKALEFSVGFFFREEYTLEQKGTMVQEITKIIREKCKKNPPVASTGSHHLTLQKK